MCPTAETRRAERKPRTLDAAALDALALRYVARYATTETKLRRYLERKLRERGNEEGEPQVEAIVARHVNAGFVDDHAFAEARHGVLQRRGYGHRRAAATLSAAGIDRDVIASLTPERGEAIEAAERYAKRRRLGAFSANPPTPELHRKQLAAMLRAGHDFDIARAVLNAADEPSDH